MRTLIKLLFLQIIVLTLASGAPAAEKELHVKNVRYFSYSAFTRIVFEVEAAAPYVLNRTQDGKGIMFTAYNLPMKVPSKFPVVKDGVVAGIETAQDAGRTTILVRLDVGAGEIKDFVLRSPDRIVLDITRGNASTTPPPVLLEGKLITVMLDPGHGGKDMGITTVQGAEKSFTLGVALSVKKILNKSSRFKVLLTREKDQSVSLDDRAAASNAAQVVVFVSIHGAAGEGSQVYLEDFSEESSQQSAKPASGDFLGFESGSGQQQLLWGRQQATHVRESGVLGRGIARRLEGRDTAEPVQAPLAGLKAVDTAAVLVECGMTRNISKIAEAIAGGIEQYVRQNR